MNSKGQSSFEPEGEALNKNLKNGVKNGEPEVLVDEAYIPLDQEVTEIVHGILGK